MNWSAVYLTYVGLKNMKNKENGMIDLSGPTDPDLSKRPFFIEPISIAAWRWIIAGIITVAAIIIFRLL